MSTAKVTALRSVEIGVTNMAAALDFYTRVWGLRPAAERRGVHYLRGSGAFHHILSLRPSPQAGLVRLVFDGADRETVDALHAQLCDAAATEIEAPRARRAQSLFRFTAGGHRLDG